jgi:hypothetical protein
MTPRRKVVIGEATRIVVESLGHMGLGLVETSQVGRMKKDLHGFTQNQERVSFVAPPTVNQGLIP